MKIINWQAYFTVHQSYTWQALQSLLDENIIYVIAQLNSEIREKQGWQTVDLTAIETIMLIKKSWWQQAKSILKEFPDAIHIFSGFWADRRFLAFILYASSKNYKIIIMNESYMTKNLSYFGKQFFILNIIKARLKPLLYAITVQFINQITSPKNICFLALSAHAKPQFIQAGFKKNQIFPFGYFVPRDKSVIKPLHNHRFIKLVFIGVLNQRKGIDLVIKAVSLLEQQGWLISLDIYGFQEIAMTFNSKSVRYCGLIPFGQTQNIIAHYDGLILPSRHDGWGVVINEALLQTVPVIISENVGAKSLLEKYSAGLIFKSDNVDDLIEKLKLFSLDSSLRQKMSTQAQKISELISPENAAGYIYDVIQHYFFNNIDRPKAIWCQ
jgi:glycosyltransferase involved in cell wall biosynthesis